MISTTFPEESEHKVHALGITAILRTFNSPMGLLADVTNGNTTSLLKRRLLTPPIATANEPSLDDLAISTTPCLWGYRQLFDSRGKTQASTAELRDLFVQAEKSFAHLRGWGQHQTSTMCPHMVGIAGEKEIKGPHGVVFWAGPVDIYYDRELTSTSQAILAYRICSMGGSCLVSLAQGHDRARIYCNSMRQSYLIRPRAPQPSMGTTTRVPTNRQGITFFSSLLHALRCCFGFQRGSPTETWAPSWRTLGSSTPLSHNHPR